MSIPSYSNDILVVGYPRSGSSWLSQLLGDVLNSPVTGLGSANPIASEGAGRPGPYTVRQLHLKPLRRGPGRGLMSAYEFNLDGYAGERIAHIHRDPRDVAVSAWKFFDYPSIKATLHSMAGKAPGALGVHGPWAEFVRGWIDARLDGLMHVCYDSLIEGPVISIMIILDKLGIEVDIGDVIDSVARQNFAIKREQIEQDGDTRPYGKALQLKHLRRGVSGDWRNHFGRREAELAHVYFWPMLKQLGYETDEDWWKL